MFSIKASLFVFLSFYLVDLNVVLFLAHFICLNDGFKNYVHNSRSLQKILNFEEMLNIFTNPNATHEFIKIFYVGIHQFQPMNFTMSNSLTSAEIHLNNINANISEKSRVTNLRLNDYEKFEVEIDVPFLNVTGNSKFDVENFFTTIAGSDGFQTNRENFGVKATFSAFKIIETKKEPEMFFINCTVEVQTGTGEIILLSAHESYKITIALNFIRNNSEQFFEKVGKQFAEQFEKLCNHGNNSI